VFIYTKFELTVLLEVGRYTSLGHLAPFTANPKEYQYKLYIARSYPWATFSLMTLWVYLLSDFRGELRKTHGGILECVMALQSHPRSMIFLLIEKAHATSC